MLKIEADGGIAPQLLRPLVHPLTIFGSYRLLPLGLDMLLESTEVYVELVQRLKQLAERSACGHHGEGVDILREALAAIAELAIRTGDVGVGVVDVA